MSRTDRRLVAEAVPLSGGEAPLQIAPRRSGRRIRFVVAAAVTLVLAAAAAHWLMQRWSHVAIDDARVAGNLVTVSAEVGGRVVAVPVVAGDTVAQGDVLITIDPAQAELELQGLDAQVAGIAAHQEQLRAQQRMIRTRVESSLAAGRAQVAAAEANHGASEAALRNARSSFDRVSALASRKVVSAQELEAAQETLDTARQQELAAAAAIEVARANLDVTRAEEGEIAILDREIATLDADGAAVAAQRDRARIDLAHHEIRAAFAGVVDSTFVDPGEYVSPGTRLLIYHDPGAIWIDANVKETQFDRIRPGAPATITVDAYPGRTFHGTVIRVGGAATSQFALLPSPNPSGNFTKVTQRLPIRVSIDQDDGRLRPGMMVELSVDVVD